MTFSHVSYNVTNAALEQNHTKAIDKRARSGSLHLHIFLPQFVLLSISPRNPSCDPFLGYKCQGQSHDSQPSQATIKLASKVNVVKNWGNLPWIRFNKNIHCITQSEAVGNNAVSPLQESAGPTQPVGPAGSARTHPACTLSLWASSWLWQLTKSSCYYMGLAYILQTFL